MPSFLIRNANRRSRKGKLPKTTFYTRDVICLPKSFSSSKCITIPRGKQRARLAEMGLQGKVTFRSDMTEVDICAEVRSAFSDVMGHNPEFQFVFLQASGCGTKTLSLPSLSASFHWTAQEVSKLGKSCIYVQAKDDLHVDNIKVCFQVNTGQLMCLYSLLQL